MSVQNEEHESPNSKISMPKLKLADLSLRISAIPLSIASLWLTLTNNEDNPDYGPIKFFNFMGLRYMVCVAAIAAGYALFAATSHWIGNLINKVWLFFVSDQVMAYLMLTSGVAGVEFIYLAYNGDVVVTWSEACTSYAMFCSKLKLALLFHFLSLFCFLLLALISAFRAFSMFYPPNDKEELVDPSQNT